MLGAIIGDTAGSVYEFNNIKTTDFPFFSPGCCYTDDSIMTMAVAEWLLRDPDHKLDTLEDCMVRMAEEYPCPMGGYGGGFSRWLFQPDTVNTYRTHADSEALTIEEVLGEEPFAKEKKATKRQPYNSWGNGSAMRVGAVGWMFDTIEETERVAKISAEITHNHPEGIKGAQATAAAIFLARSGKSKDEIRRYVSDTYAYDLARTCDQIRKVYGWEASCQSTVPEAIVAFLDSTDFESAIRLAVSLGGDSDTLACITGGIAEAFYKEIPAEIASHMWGLLPDDFREILKEMETRSDYKLPSGLGIVQK